jgi:hypothetical protein
VVKKAKVLYEYKAENEDELNLVKGDTITITKEGIFDGWHEGEKDGVVGVFPDNFVEVFEEDEQIKRMDRGPVVKRSTMLHI